MTDHMSLAEESDAVLRDTGVAVMPSMDVRVDNVRDATIRDALETGIRALIESNQATSGWDDSSIVDARPNEWDVSLLGPFDTPQLRAHVADFAEGRRLAALAVSSDPGAAEVARCVCATRLPGHRIQPSSAEIRWWNPDGTFKRTPAGTVDWTIALYPGPGAHDALRMNIRDGAVASPQIPKTQVLVGLANRTDWAKEIWAANICTGRTQAVHQESKNKNYHRMLLDKAACRAGSDTIVFRKPGFFGIWTDIAYFAPSWFWPAFGGTILDFEWAFD